MTLNNTSLSIDRKMQWRVLIALGIGAIFSLAGDLTLYAVLPTYADTRAFDLATIGLILSANRLTRLVSNPVIGLLLAGARRRRFVLTGFGLGSVSTLLYVVAPGPGLFLAGRILWGLAWSMIYIGSYCMVLDISSEQDRGWASGILQGFTFVGLGLMPLVGGMLSDWLGFSNALSICALLSAAGFLAALAFLPETSHVSQFGRPDDRSTPSHAGLRGTIRSRVQLGAAALQQTFSNFRQLLHMKNLIVNFIYLTTNFISEGILLSTLSLYVSSQYGEALRIGGYHIPAATAGGALLALRATVSALVSPLAGSLSDRSRSRWSGIAWGISIGATGMFLVAGLDTPFGLLAGVVLAASGSALIITVVPALAKEVNPDSESGTILGVLANSADLGMAIAPLVAYTLVESLSLPVIYLIAGVALAAGLPLALIAARQPPAVA